MSKPRIEVSDMYDDAPPSPRLTRKRAIVKDSLKGFAESYTKLGFTKKQAGALAQLAYGQKQIRKRLEAIEAVELARMFGMVSIGGDHHLLECAKRDDKKNPCSCGSTPAGATKEG